MATDIAFSLAILNLLGKRVPVSLKIFLTAFAIVDDIGAVLVIAVFYSEEIKIALLLIALVPILILAVLGRFRYYSKYLWISLGSIVWLLFLKAGIHPTIAGVLLAFTVPIRRKIRIDSFKVKLKEIVDQLKGCDEGEQVILSKEQINQIDDLEDWTEKVQSPLQHLEHKLHPWVAYFIMPLFALANAGVVFDFQSSIDTNIIFLITICLFLGNIIGIPLITMLGVKLKITELPDDIRFIHIIGVAFLAGVGFTMSIFISNLAFTDNLILTNSAKIGILAGSLLSGITGYLILRSAGRKMVK